MSSTMIIVYSERDLSVAPSVCLSPGTLYELATEIAVSLLMVPSFGIACHVTCGHQTYH